MNTYGDKLRISIFGESHGPMIGVILDGVPAGIPLTVEDFLPDLARRKSGAKGTTPRKEDDLPQIVSGICEGCTTGAPLTITFQNKNINSVDYSSFRELPRPGHADFVAQTKYNFFNDISGGGHFSGRLTLVLVAAGVIAKKLIGPIKISAVIKEIGGEKENWQPIIDDAIAKGDSVGGIIECTCNNIPIGLGEPFFNSLESQISHLVFSIPATRGIEFGDGFKAATMKGSQHNDCYIDNEGHTLTNGAGGINGGISNGNPIIFRVAIKPTSSISKPQTSYNFITEQVEEFSVKGRHDACIALRCPVIIEAVAAIVFANA
ncbi:MAG: chorismate synthase [Bacteroidales bacterium]